MRILIIVVTFFTSTMLMGQSIREFQVSKAQNREVSGTNNILKQYEVLDFPIDDVLNFVSRGSEFSDVKLDIEGHKAIHLVIYPYDIRSDDYINQILTNDGRSIVQKSPNITYRGYVDDASKGELRLTITDSFINMQFPLNGKMYYLESANRYSQRTEDVSVLLYSEDDISEGHVGHCGSDIDAMTIVENEPIAKSRANDCYESRIAIAVDYSMVADPSHNSIAAVINQTMTIMNNVDANYSLSGGDNFQDGIEFKLVSHLVSSCESCDPWTTSTNLNQVLTNFYVWGSNDGFATEFDVAQFWTDRNFDGQAVGLAHQASDLICSDAAYHILQDWTANIPLLRTMTSHEIAHNFNSVHVGGSGMIMSSVVSNTMSWATATKTTVNTELTNYLPSCLPICSSSFAPCDEINNPVIDNVTATGFDVSWDAMSNASIDIIVRDNTGSTIQTISTTSNSITLSPPGFTPCRIYYVSLLHDCGADKSAYREILFESPNSQGCAGFSSLKPVAWVGQPVEFIDESVNATSWLWDFGDGTTSTLQNPTHTYSGADYYDVSLTVNGNADTKLLEEFVKVLPTRSLPYSAADGGDFDNNIYDFAADKIEGDFSLFERGIATNNLTSTSNVWKTFLDNDIGNLENESVLYTPKFDLSSPGTYTVSFEMGMELIFCNAPGAAQMQYSLDDGSSWTRLGSYGDSGPGINNWYTSGPGASCPLSTLVFADQTGWAFVGNYNSKSYDISFLSGNSSVIFRFVYSVSSSFSGGYNIDGILLDNFAVDAVFQTLAINNLNFDAKPIDDRVKLNWTNQGEEDVAMYILEKSQTGTDFDKIYATEANGNALYNNYKYTDIDAQPGTTYYRLKIVNVNGDIEYSDTRTVRMMGSEIGDIKLYPNPVDNDHLYIELGNVSDDVSYRIYNTAGQLISQSSNVQLQNGRFEISLLSVETGIYFIELLNNEQTIYKDRIIKI